VHRLDSRAPLVVDTRELGRRAGSMREVTRTVPAPANLGLDVIRVPEASPLELDLRLEAVVDGVLVSGTARAQLAGECVRCLEPVSSEVDVEFQELYVYPEDPAAYGHASQPKRGEEGEEEEGISRLVGDLLDLEPLVRDAVVLSLPFQPVCRDDCPGLCPECGALLAEDPGHEHASTDARWAALQDLFVDSTVFVESTVVDSHVVDSQFAEKDSQFAEKEES
jgi:uncharacterized protein